MPAERLQKLMAQAGIASRRHAEALIAEGRVTINGKAAKVGDKADLATDDVRVDGSRLHVEERRVYLMINKPMGVVTAVSAQEQETRRTVRDLVPIKGYLYPVGRLDVDSEGLILLTNDGDLAQKLSHPRYEHPKVYEVGLTGNVPDEALDIWRRGIVLEDGPTKPVDIRVTGRDKEMTWIKVTMREGRKRQIRRIAGTLGYPVRKLVRVQFDTLTLGGLKPGDWRYLNEAEIAKLQHSAGNMPIRKKPRRDTHSAHQTKRTQHTNRTRSRSSSPNSSRSKSSDNSHDNSDASNTARRPANASRGRGRSSVPSSSPSSRSSRTRKPTTRHHDRTR